PEELLRLTLAGEDEPGSQEGDQGIEHVILFLPVEVIGGRDGEAAPTLGEVVLPGHHDPVGVGVRQGLQEDRVDDAEDRRVGADAKTQGQDGYGGEPRILDEQTESVAQVLPEGFHGTTSVVSSTTRPSNRCTVLSACRAKRWSWVTMQMVAPPRCRPRSSSITASPFL